MDVIARQKSIALLTVTTLLLGNLAGWVHVHEVADSVTPSATVSASHCCHAGCTADLPADTENEDDPVAPHDSDDCSVSNLIYTVRQAVDLSPDLEIANHFPLATDAAPVASHQIISQWLDGPISSRGPPVV